MESYDDGYGYKVICLPGEEIAIYLDTAWPPVLHQVYKMEDIPEKNRGIELSYRLRIKDTVEDHEIPKYLRRYEFRDGWLIVDRTGTIHEASDSAWLQYPRQCLALFLTDIAEHRERDLLSDPEFKESEDAIIVGHYTGCMAIRIYNSKLNLELDDIKHLIGRGRDVMFDRDQLVSNGHPGPILCLLQKDDHYAWITVGEVDVTLPKGEEAYWQDYLRERDRNTMWEIGFRDQDIIEMLILLKPLGFHSEGHIHIVSSCDESSTYAILDSKTRRERYVADDPLWQWVRSYDVINAIHRLERNQREICIYDLVNLDGPFKELRPKRAKNISIYEHEHLFAGRDTPRSHRLYSRNYPLDMTKDGHVKLQDGEPTPGIKIKGQTIAFDFTKVCPDDMLSIARQLYHYNRERSLNEHIYSIEKYLTKAIYAGDKHTMKYGGYSSHLEANLPTPSDY